MHAEHVAGVDTNHHCVAPQAMQRNAQSSYRLGSHPAGDEQTMRFQGRSAFKMRITYKAEGDGFQCDAICQDGFTYCFYFRQSPPPAKFTTMGFSPLHARILGLFETLPDAWYRITFDNLYISAKFIKQALKMKVLVGGVARQSGRGVPEIVKQEKKTSREDVEAVRGTVKAAVQRGAAATEPNLVAVSCYDQKPVYYLTTMAECIEWIIKNKKVFSAALKKMITVNFLRLNILDEYNFNMNSVDIADQLRNYLRLDKNIRNWKWWWALFFWGMGVTSVNSYVLYKMFHRSQGHTPKTHYDFQRLIVLALLDPQLHDPNKVLRRRRRRRITRRLSQGVSIGTAVADVLNGEEPSAAGAVGDAPDAVTSISREQQDTRRLTFAMMMSGNRLGPQNRCGPTHKFVDIIPVSDDEGKQFQDRCQWCANRWFKNVKFTTNDTLLKKRISAARKAHGGNTRKRCTMFCLSCRVKLCVPCWNDFHTAKIGKDKK